MAQDFLDYLSNVNPRDPGYDPILQNINSPMPGRPQPEFMPSGMGAGFAPPVTGANPPSPADIATPPGMNLDTAFAPTPEPNGGLGTPVAPINNMESGVTPPPPGLSLDMKGKPGAGGLPWGSVDKQITSMEEAGLKSKSDIVSAGQEYNKAIAGLPEIAKPDIATAVKPELASIEAYKGKVGELEKAQIAEAPQIAKVQEDAAKTAKFAYDAAEQNISNAETELKDIEKNVAAIPPIDANKFWSDKSTGSKIMMGVAMALAAITPEGATRAQSIIKDLVDKDIDAQKTNMYKKLAGAKSAKESIKSRLEINTDKLKNKLAAIEMTRAEGYAKAIQDTQLKMKGVQNAASLQAADKMIADLQVKMEESKANAMNAVRADEEKKAGNVYKVATDAAEASKNLANIYGNSAQLNLAKLKARSDAMLEQMKIATAGQGKPMTLAEKERYDLVKSGKQAVADMRAALASGSNTFSLIGDNPYTTANYYWGEAIGRLQSQGAITKDEEAKFKKMAPTMMDSDKIKQLKLKNMDRFMDQRLGTIFNK